MGEFEEVSQEEREKKQMPVKNKHTTGKKDVCIFHHNDMCRKKAKLSSSCCFVPDLGFFFARGLLSYLLPRNPPAA